jgi:hypothetical protein
LDGRDAGSHGFTIHQHRARAALSLAAAVFGAGHLQILAQDFEKRAAGAFRDGYFLSVDVEMQLHDRTPFPGSGQLDQ